METERSRQRFEYEIAQDAALCAIWEKNVRNNADDARWLVWREEYIKNHRTGKGKTFLVLCDGEPVGEGTLLLSPSCRAAHGKTVLTDGKETAYVNALRIEKPYEGQGHISRLMHLMEEYAHKQGYKTLTIGVDAKETRNLAIYLHWGYTRFIMHEVEDGELVLYYAKQIQ